MKIEKEAGISGGSQKVLTREDRKILAEHQHQFPIIRAISPVEWALKKSAEWF